MRFGTFIHILISSFLTLLTTLLKDLGQLCCLQENPYFYGKRVAQYQALGSRRGIWPEQERERWKKISIKIISKVWDLREFRNTFAGEEFPPLSHQIWFLLNCFDGELHCEVAWQGGVHPLAQTLGRLTLGPEKVQLITKQTTITHCSLIFFRRSAGAYCFLSTVLLLNRFSIVSGTGKSEMVVIWESSATDFDLTTSALAACTSGSSTTLFVISFVSVREAGNVS